MISLTTLMQNTDGAVLIDDAPNFSPETLQARLSRVKTLDGSCVIVHSGVSDNDRTLKVVGVLGKADRGRLLDIFYKETSVCISSRDGFFLGAIQSLQLENGKGQTTASLLLGGRA